MEQKNKSACSDVNSFNIHASGEDYLETILVLQKKLGMVRSVDVARHMEVSKPSVCHAVATLRDGGFLTMDEDFQKHRLRNEENQMCIRDRAGRTFALPCADPHAG